MGNQRTFIDLFCGAGGMSYGFEMAGFKPVLAIDNWQDALDTYNHNNPSGRTLCADLSNIDVKKVASEYGVKNVDLIIGGPPCQGYSIAGKRIVDDIRNKLYKSFVSFVAYFSPKAFVMENVPNILSIGDGIVRESILNDFRELGYDVQYKVLTASDYGVPQNRKRAIFVGLKKGSFSFPEQSVVNKVTASEALSDLPEGSVDDGIEYQMSEQSEYQKWARSKSKGIYNHEVTSHSEKTQHIISLVPDGGNYKDLPEGWGESRKFHMAWTRLNGNAPARTVDTGHRNLFHYVYNRVPTVRESARMQSFPDDFIFTGTKTQQSRQVGNAVPPLLGQALGEALLEIIQENNNNEE